MLPKNLKYGSKVESAISRSYRTNIQPQNGTGPYNLGDTITVNIPTRANLVLVPSESYIKFRTTITSGAAANNFRWGAAGAHSIFQRIRVWSGSNLLQDIDNYGLLCDIMYNMQVSTDSAMGKMNVTAGTRNDLVTVQAATFTASAGLSSLQVNSGELIGANPSVASGATVSDTYCLTLISLMGSLCTSNYFPLFAATSAPIRIELQLVANLVQSMAVAQATVSTAQLTNFEYVGQFIELGDQAMSMIYGGLDGQPLQFTLPDWRNYQFTSALANGVATSVNMPIPAKFSSLKALVCTTRPNGTGLPTFFPFSSNTLGFNNYQFRLGSEVVPSKPVDTVQECFQEAQKALASLSDLNYQPSVEKASFNQNAPVASVDSATSVSSASSGCFYAGIDLESYAGASKDTIFSGYNSNTSDIYWSPTFTAPSSVPACRFDAFANFDSVIVCENGTAYVKF
jgi:hypothetical protein